MLMFFCRRDSTALACIKSATVGESIRCWSCTTSLYMSSRVCVTHSMEHNRLRLVKVPSGVNGEETCCLRSLLMSAGLMAKTKSRWWTKMEPELSRSYRMPVSKRKNLSFERSKSLR